MPSTHTSLHFHVVFSTKERDTWFDSAFRPKLFSYLGGVVRGLDGLPHAIGGVSDHVHLSIGLKPTHPLSDIVREVKSESSRWIKDELGRTAFAWQDGYGAFTFGATDLEKVRDYVLKQEEHHRKVTFQEEYLRFLERGLVEYDENYLW